MMVIDASAVLNLILAKPPARAIGSRIFAAAEWIAAPDLLELEVLQVLRRLSLADEIPPDRAVAALEYFHDLPIDAIAHRPLSARIWALRHQLSAYDAAYVSLAEALDAPLLTCDRRLSNAHGHHARIEFAG